MEAESTRIFGGQKVVLRETEQALTPFDGMVVFLEFLHKIGLVKKMSECGSYPKSAISVEGF